MEQEKPIEIAEQPRKGKNEVWEWIKALLIAAALVFVIRTFIFAPFIVEGPSMEPNFYTGERLIVNKLIHSMRKPHRGEVVVFHAPAGKDYIKRVIALPGETVKVENNKVYINGEELKEPYIENTVAEWAKNGRVYTTWAQKELTVPEGKMFVMGDDRPNSSDSREPSVGPIGFDKVVGRADLIYWPLDKLKIVKHKF